MATNPDEERAIHRNEGIDIPYYPNHEGGSLLTAGFSFVGSPDQADGSELSDSTRPVSPLGSPTRPADRLDARQSPSPGSSHNTLRPSRFATGFRQPAHPPQERQWTLFGELMANELRGSESREGRLYPPMVPSTSESSSHSIFEDEGSRVQSPPQFLPNPDLHAEYDSDDSEDSHAPTASSHRTRVEAARRWYSISSRLPKLSNLQRNVAKCVVAYFIASLFTFSPYLSSFIADISSDNEPGKSTPSPAGHMVATMSVKISHNRSILIDLPCF